MMVSDPTPEQIHTMDQQWMYFSTQLDKQLERLRRDIPAVYESTGLHGTSIAFAAVWGYIKQAQADEEERSSSLRQQPRENKAVKMTEVMCAVALTRLLKESQTQQNTSEQVMMAAVKINEAVDILKELARAPRAENEMEQFEERMRDGNG
jgi:hypothetical protein